MIKLKGQRLLYLWLFLFCCISFQSPASRNTDTISKDSLKLYRKIEKFSKKHKVTRELFDHIFRLPAPHQPTHTPAHVKTKNKKKNVKKKSFDHDYQGKIIRSIKVVTFDPFGYSLRDTTKKPIGFFEKFGNFYHVRTRRFLIKNQLLFKQGEKADQLKMYESERIIRQFNFIRDVMVAADTSYKSKDSVDIIVRVQDRWSLNPDFSFGGGRFSTSVSENNFQGIGHQLEGGVNYRIPFTTDYGYYGRYSKQNISNTFISLNASFIDQPLFSTKTIGVNRSFYSPLARWAGGVEIGQNDFVYRYFSLDSTIQTINLRSWHQDYWMGIAFPLIKEKNDFDRTSKIVLAGRVFNRNFRETLPLTYDRYFSSQNSTSYFLSLGFTQRQFFKDTYLFKYGVTEDVPIGKLIAFTGGYEKRLFDFRYYTGFKTAAAFHFTSGYVAPYIEIGSFFKDQKMEQGVANVGIGYFTNLLNISKSWKIRQFAFVNVTYGFNRFPIEKININNVNGLKGFKADSVVGSNKMVLGTQTTIYTPWYLLGFRFAPIFYFGIGMIGDDQKPFFLDSAYPVIGVGLNIRNEYLIFNTFQISLGFYPYIPNQGLGIFKLNPLNNNDFQIRDYELGKPGQVAYY